MAQRARGVAALVCATWLCSGAGCGVRPEPIASASFQPEAAEAELWKAAQEALDFVERSGGLFEDAALDAYLARVARKLLPHLGAPDAGVRIFVLKYPYANAVAAPNGDIYLNTGVLARIENEHQLATLLGHELAHFVRRHAYDRRRSRAAPLFRHPLDHARELEREADRLGFDAMAAAGYDTAEALRFFQLLLAATGERDAEIEGRDAHGYSSHPRLVERVESYRALAASARGRTRAAVATADYEAHILPLLLPNAELDVARGRLRSARLAIDRYLVARPASGDGYLALGAWHSANLSRRGDLESAIAAFERAVELAPDSPRAHRELGLLYRAEGRTARARASLARYLELAPDASDRLIIEGFLRTAELPAVSAE